MRYSQPASIDEAIAMARADGEHAFIAGGTDLMVRRAQGTLRTPHLIDLGRIAALRAIAATPSSVTIGAGVTLASLIAHREIAERFPALAEAARTIASPLVRTTATVAGNLLCENRCVYFDQTEFWRNAVGYCLKCDGEICIATGGTKGCSSVFISDLAPVLICLGARAEIVDARGTTTAAIETLYSGDGVAPRTLAAGAIITRIVIPVGADRTLYYRKLRPRASVDFTNLTLAIRRVDGTIVAAASGVGPAPSVARLPATSSPDELVSALLAGTKIIDNLPFKRGYRREMMRAMVMEEAEGIVFGALA